MSVFVKELHFYNRFVYNMVLLSIAYMYIEKAIFLSQAMTLLVFTSASTIDPWILESLNQPKTKCFRYGYGFIDGFI